MVRDGETKFAGGKKAKIWTFIILGIVLLGGILLGNFVLVNPDTAREGFGKLLGLPSWVYPVIALGVGSLIFWLGLKVETDWPEILGAALISGSLYAGEVMIGWKRLAFGGMTAIPIVLPLVVFFVLVAIALTRSV